MTIDVSDERKRALGEYEVMPQTVDELAYCFWKVMQHYKAAHPDMLKIQVLMDIGKAHIKARLEELEAKWPA